jgi:hypothetical protein
MALLSRIAAKDFDGLMTRFEGAFCPGHSDGRRPLSMTGYREAGFDKMSYEKSAENGLVRVIDDRTHEVIALKLTFQARKECTLCGGKYREGDMIVVIFPACLDRDKGREQCGPWEPGGFTSHWIRNNCMEIVEVATRTTIYRAPYAKSFLGAVNRAARYQAMRVVFRQFMERGTY